MLGCTQIDHIGIAVASIDEQRDHYEQVLGMTCRGTEELTDLGVKVAFFSPPRDVGGTALELLEPIAADSAIARYLERRGPGLHHVAYSVEDLDAQLQSLRDGGFQLVDKVPRLGAHGRRIAFLHPSSTFGVLTELCEAIGS